LKFSLHLGQDLGVEEVTVAPYDDPVAKVNVVNPDAVPELAVLKILSEKVENFVCLFGRNRLCLLFSYKIENEQEYYVDWHES